MSTILKFFGVMSAFCLILFCNSAFAAELKVLLNGSVINLNPTTIQDSASFLVNRHLNCQLFRHTYGSNIVPEAAKSFKVSDDGLRIDIVLKDDIYFSNGDPVTSKDVKATLENMTGQRPSFGNIPNWIKNIDITSDKEFSIILKKRTSTIFRALLGPSSVIVSAKYLNEVAAGKKSWNEPVGCGTYKIASWAEGKYVKLSPLNDQKLPDIIFFLMPKNGIAPEMLNQYDVIGFYTPPGNLKNYHKEYYFDPWLLLATPNTHLSHWDTKEKRCLAFQKIDPAPFWKAYENNNMHKANDILPAGVLGYNPNDKMQNYLPTESSGFDKIPFLKVMILGLSVAAEKRWAVKDAFSTLADKVETTILVDAKEFPEDFAKSKADFLVLGLRTAYNDAYEILQTFLNPKLNPTGYADKELVKKIEDSQFISDTRQRGTAYQEISKYVKERCLIYPLLYINSRSVWVRDGISLPGLGETVFNEYYLGNTKFSH